MNESVGINLKAWMNQQRDSYWRFFGENIDEIEGSPFSAMVKKSDPGFEVIHHAPRVREFLRPWHHSESTVLRIDYRYGKGRSGTLSVPCPDDDEEGLFSINGIHYSAPIQRVLPRNEEEVDESSGDCSGTFRRIEHVLEDVWTRRDLPQYRSGMGQYRTLSKLASEGESIERLLRTWADISLMPATEPGEGRRIAYGGTEGSELLLYPVETLCNKLSGYLPGVQIRTFLMRGKARQASSNNDVNGTSSAACEDGKECDAGYYTSITSGESLKRQGAGIRRRIDGMDAWHTPDNESIGLVRYLSIGSKVSEARCLTPSEEPIGGLGLASGLVPFLQHDDPRRILIACNEMRQALTLEKPEEPKVTTDTWNSLRSVAGREPVDGVNLLVAFMFWKGMNYEDAFVISRSAAQKLKSRVKHRINVGVRCFLRRAETTDGKYLDGIIREGVEVKAWKDPLLKVTADAVELGLLEDRLLLEEIREDKQPLRTLDKSLETLSPQELLARVSGRVAKVCHRSLLEMDDIPSAARSWRETFVFEIEEKLELEIGDKIANLHGNKGVVSEILRDEDMPVLEDGTRIEILANPIGLYNRGNYGQVLEAISTLKHDPGMKNLVVEENGLEYCRIITGGASGEEKNTIKALAGFNFFIRLPQTAASQAAESGDNPVRCQMTGQFRRGGGPQKVGEMEVWALQAHGAEKCLNHLHGLVNHGAKTPGETRKAAIEHWLRAAGLHIEESEGEIYLKSSSMLTDPEGTDFLEAAKKEICRKGTETWPLAGVLRLLQSDRFFRKHSDLMYIRFDREIPLQKRHKVLNINTARAEDLENLEGIGSVLARRIVKRRTDKGYFKDIDELCEVEGIKPSLLKGIRPWLSLKTNVNTAPRSELARLPGMNANLLRALIKHRKKTPEGFKDIDSLLVVLGMTQDIDTLDKFRDLVTTDAAVLSYSAEDDDKSVPTFRYIHLLPPRYRSDTGGSTNHPLTCAYAGMLNVLRQIESAPDSQETPEEPQELEYSLRRVLEEVLLALTRKDGVIDETGLALRVPRSGRFVIIPDMKIPIDGVRLPEGTLEWLERVRREGQDADSCDDNGLLRVLLNREPTLHRYGMTAVRPDSMPGPRNTMGIHPFTTTPFGADFDGDTMAFFAVNDPECHTEMEGLLSPLANLFNTELGGPVLEVRKDFALGLWKCMQDEGSRTALLSRLSAAGVRIPPGNEALASPGDFFELFCDRLRLLSDSSSVRDSFAILLETCLSGLEKVETHSVYGRMERMSEALSEMVEKGRDGSGAVKAEKFGRTDEEYFGGDSVLAEGIPDMSLKAMADARISLMIDLNMAKGDTGGLLRRIYYNLNPQRCNGFAFEGQIRDALRAAQAITEKATQRTLSPKSAGSRFKFKDFEKILRKALISRDDETCEEVAQLLDLGKKTSKVRQLIIALSNAGATLKTDSPAKGTILGFMRYKYGDAGELLDYYRELLLGDRGTPADDPRVRFLLE